MQRRTLLTTMLFAWPAALLAADAANMSGDWVLNAKESRWGKKKPPLTVTLHIQHNEPQYKYTGEVRENTESQGTKFFYDGAIDGSERRVKEDQSERKVIFKRTGSHSIESTFTSLDGKTVEKATTIVSNDGKKLTRRITLTSPEGKVNWTEVYDKQ